MNRLSIRKRGYDYSLPAYYFVTICTYMSQPLFDTISDGVMNPSDVGKVVENVWSSLTKHYSGIELDSFVLMPNHLHGVVRIIDYVGAGLRPARSKVQLSEVVRALKSFSSRKVNNLNFLEADVPLWRRGYYDRIIRTEKELNIVRLYIKTNPLLWKFDPENMESVTYSGKLDGFSEDETELVRNYLEYRINRGRINR